MVGLGETVSVMPLMETVTCADAVQPFKSPTTVYVVVEGGNACTDEPVVLLNPVAGLHAYVFAPEAVNVAGSPLQIAVFGETVSTGIGFIVTVVCADAEQPFISVPVTVYEVVEEGFAVTEEPVVLLRLLAGLHV